MKIVDYNEKYADEIDAIEATEWEVEGARKEYLYGKIFKIAVDENDHVIGCTYGKIAGDLFHLDVIIVKKEERNKKIATLLLKELLEDERLCNIKNIVATVLCYQNHMNAQGLMKEFEFEELFRIKGYWGTYHPDVICKICGQKPCECTCVIFLKKRT